MTYQELIKRLKNQENHQTLDEFLEKLYQKIHQQILETTPQLYSQNPEIIGVYDYFFTKFQPIPSNTLIRSGYRNMYGDLTQENINQQILSLRDFYNNLIFFKSLTEKAKWVYTLHKRDPSILGSLLRLDKSKFKKNPDIKPILKSINFIHSIYRQAPKTTKSMILYRAEREFDSRKDVRVGEKYKMEGYTSFSVDPRIGYFFNKTLTEKNGKFYMDYVWKISVPKGVKIVIPAIDKSLDPEFEILLPHNSKILVESIEMNKEMKGISPQNEPKTVVVKKLITGKLSVNSH